MMENIICLKCTQKSIKKDEIGRLKIKAKFKDINAKLSPLTIVLNKNVGKVAV